ncbi:MAG: pilus assembly protein N-terminal domain-containing protein [Candidatus Hydrothermales bacterium]
MILKFFLLSYLVLYEGYSKLFKFVRPVKSVAVGNPEILGMRLISDREVLLNALKEGVTNLIIFTDKGTQEIECVIKKRTALQFHKPKVIRIDVWVLELERSKKSDYGFEWLKQLGFEEGKIPETFPLDVGPIKRVTNLTSTLNFLEEKGALKILSHPTLVVLEDKTSEFLSGGEIPVIIPQALGAATVEWKEYGVKLKITAKLDDFGYIILNLEPEISDLDYAHAVVLQDFVVPAIRKSNVKVEVKLLPGESLLLGGLRKKTMQEFRSSIPLLGKIPILGKLLFTRIKNENLIKDVIFIVTPEVLPYERGAARINIYKGLKTLEFYIPTKVFNGTTYFELSEIFERELSISYTWVEKEKLAEIRFGKKKSFLSVEKSTLEIDGVAFPIKPEIKVQDGILYVPFSFFEIIGLSGFWDPYTSDFYVLETLKETQ